MASVNGKNALITFAAGVCARVISLAMTPYYLKKIGFEGFGVIGFTTLVTTVLGVFIAGATKTLQRDISIAHASSPRELSGILKGGIIAFSALAVVLGVIIYLAGLAWLPSIAADTGFSNQSLSRSLFAISCTLPATVFANCIIAAPAALRDQVWVGLQAMLIGIGFAFVTWLSLEQWSTIDVFYFCQLSGSFLTLVLVGFRLWWVGKKTFLRLPQRTTISVWKGKFKKTGKLTAVLVLHEGLGMVISQMDRMIIAAIYPIASLGAYNLGANAARMTSLTVSPIGIVTYPEICALQATGAEGIVVGEYIARVSLVLYIIGCASLIFLIAAGQKVLELWLGAALVPQEALLCCILLSIGHFSLALAGTFYNVTVAYGKVGYGVYFNLISLLILAPAGFLMVKKFGISGVSMVWMAYGIITLVVCMIAAYKRHADLSGGIVLLKAALGCILTGAILSWLLSALGLAGYPSVCAATGASILHTLLYLFVFFRGNPRNWLHLLEAAKPGLPGHGYPPALL
jgi:O-antigen/teichoic acid export membrane protein